ncbi:MAG: alpha/beta hydrolase [Lewinellaceae bacterium]|nr:alpha/beta hydrolase [Lewinellaceae bacterium]
MHLDLFVPQKRIRQGYPGVILIHGGGWSSGSKAHLVPMAQQLAARGIIAAAVEYRLSPEAVYPAAVNDLQEAIRWLRANAARYQLDTARMAALGCSAGAQLASLIGTMPQGLLPYPSAFPHISAQVQAVVNIDGIVSFVHPEADAEGVAAGKWLGGTRQTAAKQWREASALEYLNASTPPFLFVNSVVPRFHAGRDDFAAGLARYGTYYEIHTIPDTPHGFCGPLAPT